MKARRLAPVPRVARALARDGREGIWRIGDLPAGLDGELGARLAQAERGEGLLPYGDAMADVDRMVEEILAVAPSTTR